MIQIKHLSFGYIKQPLLLVDASVDVKSENLIITGEIQSGKTTFLELCCGMQDLFVGSILLDQNSPKNCCKNITYLPCDVVALKNKTIKENFEYACLQVDKPFDKSLFCQQFYDQFYNTKFKKLSKYNQAVFALERAKIKDAKFLFIDINLNEFEQNEIETYAQMLQSLLDDNNKQIVLACSGEDFKKLHLDSKNSKFCYIFATKVHVFENFDNYKSNLKFSGMAKYLLQELEETEVTLMQNGFILNWHNRQIKVEDKYMEKIQIYFDESTVSTKLYVFFDKNINEMSDQQFNEFLGERKILLFDKLTAEVLN